MVKHLKFGLPIDNSRRSSVLNAFLMGSEDTAHCWATPPDFEKFPASGLSGGRWRLLRLRFLSFFRCPGRRLLEALGIRLQICVGGGLDGVRFIRAGTRSSAKSARQQNYSEECFHRKKLTAGFGRAAPPLHRRQGAGNH